MMATATVKRSARARVSVKTAKKSVHATRTVHAKHGHSSCFRCGYRAVHLHRGECPMCLDCARCKNEVHSCTCIEGE